jgi:hypothetical protein
MQSHVDEARHGGVSGEMMADIRACALEAATRR